MFVKFVGAGVGAGVVAGVGVGVGAGRERGRGWRLLFVFVNFDVVTVRKTVT